VRIIIRDIRVPLYDFYIPYLFLATPVFTVSKIASSLLESVTKLTNDNYYTWKEEMENYSFFMAVTTLSPGRHPRQLPQMLPLSFSQSIHPFVAGTLLLSAWLTCPRKSRTGSFPRTNQSLPCLPGTGGIPQAAAIQSLVVNFHRFRNFVHRPYSVTPEEKQEVL
jgi:hypothetical protein